MQGRAAATARGAKEAAAEPAAAGAAGPLKAVGLQAPRATPVREAKTPAPGVPAWSTAAPEEVLAGWKRALPVATAVTTSCRAARMARLSLSIRTRRRSSCWIQATVTRFLA